MDTTQAKKTSNSVRIACLPILQYGGRCLQVNIEDFRVVTESFGMQLDDDSLLALFSQVSWGRLL